MTKPKTSRIRRGRGFQEVRPTTPSEYRLRAHRFRRAVRRDQGIAVLFEHLGHDYDDVLVNVEYNDEPAVAAIVALPLWARWWDSTFKTWRIHPGYADRLAASLRSLGYRVVDGW
ncbi:hypothetical protein [Mycobacterium simiae]|uniref:Uncharacterized protein n=1 Tax=Mycobacterium simiae TaxID=1784 RepID=A0A1X0XYB6_MYCSI|nr:hypothetical protein [Mycobacterium simiae]ORJ57788.1 hypothetical protein B5M45_19460 [Mycobacterium simiae]